MLPYDVENEFRCEHATQLGIENAIQFHGDAQLQMDT